MAKYGDGTKYGDGARYGEMQAVPVPDGFLKPGLTIFDHMLNVSAVLTGNSTIAITFDGQVLVKYDCDGMDRVEQIVSEDGTRRDA